MATPAADGFHFFQNLDNNYFFVLEIRVLVLKDFKHGLSARFRCLENG